MRVIKDVVVTPLVAMFGCSAICRLATRHAIQIVPINLTAYVMLFYSFNVLRFPYAGCKVVTATSASVYTLCYTDALFASRESYLNRTAIQWSEAENQTRKCHQILSVSVALSLQWQLVL